ncbi:MAG TPA: peptidoglycan-associated lipoprotein Pal [Terriglobales bacterium]|nr:peptidoglycan-associated lipoprotein Pal [Terriglobales bacterium]
MKHSRMKWITIVAALASLMVLASAGCKKKEVAPPPPPPPPPQPTASLTANPSTIQRGQSTTLTWQTTNATDVTLEGIGAVEANGSRQVTPSDSTTYRLTAKGAGGTQEATARVTVTQPPPPPVAAAPSDEELFNQNVKDAFFDFDKSDIRPDAQQALMADAAFLQQHPNIRFTVEGHCDERGSTEYNLGLGDRRATAVKDFLVQQGVSADRIRTISYGKEKPFCTEHTEDCWQQNRRGHFVYQR